MGNEKIWEITGDIILLDHQIFYLFTWVTSIKNKWKIDVNNQIRALVSLDLYLSKIPKFKIFFKN